MSAPPVTLHAPDGAPLDLAAVHAALDQAFEVSAGSPARERRVLLDTFDHRLRSAGLRLVQRSGPQGDQLVLDGGTGRTLQADASGLTWPALAGALPAGPLRAAVEPVAGIRAMLPQRDERRSVRRIEARNSDDKVVVRLEVDEPVGEGEQPAAVHVVELRGYEREARRATRLLEQAGLRAARPEAPGAEASLDVFDRREPALALLAAELADFRRAVLDNVAGTVDDVDTEFLHDLRVAVRRTRSTLKLGRSVLPERLTATWEPEFKWLGDVTTPVRDLDVYELDLPVMARWLVAAKPSDLRPFAACLRAHRRTERRVLVRALRSKRFATVMAAWGDDLAQLPDNRDQGPGTTAGELADRSIARAYRRVRRLGDGITDEAPPEDLHSLRKRCKEMRYAIDVFAPVVDPATRKKVVADLKGLQDVLGRYQDSEVQRHALRSFADEMVAGGVAAQALLAMGELIGHLESDQDRARREFTGVYRRFTRSVGERRLRQLAGHR